MPSGRAVRIGLETDFLNGPMTGVGNYCFHLLTALMASHPDFQFSGFSQLTWEPFGLEHLRQVDRAYGKTDLYLAAPTTRSKTRQVQQSLRAAAARIDLARRIYRHMRMARFRQGDTLKNLSLFHAFKYLPPVDLAIPILPVVYDLSFVRFPETHPKQRLQELERLPAVVSRAPFVHTISEFSKAEIATVYGYPRERIVVAPPAASAIFRPLGQEITQKDIASFDVVPGYYFLAVGTLEPRKNLRTLITAYSGLSSRIRRRIPLIIAGGAGWGDLKLPSSADRMMSDGSLRFLGTVSNPILRSLYEGARALLFPSIYEGFGMPAVEALACGTEVVHSSGTSMDEITEGTSRNVPPMDVTAWTIALQDISENPMHGAGDRELRIARSRRFNWQHSAEAIGQLYRNFPEPAISLR